MLAMEPAPGKNICLLSILGLLSKKLGEWILYDWSKCAPDMSCTRQIPKTNKSHSIPMLPLLSPRIQANGSERRAVRYIQRSGKPGGYQLACYILYAVEADIEIEDCNVIPPEIIQGHAGHPGSSIPPPAKL